MARMSRPAWRKTPYAGTTARRTDQDVQRLLARHGVRDHMVAQGRDERTGRLTYAVRFRLRDAWYRVQLSVLDADAPEPDRLCQVQRAVFYQIKAALEAASVFFGAEETLLPYREIVPAGPTVAEAVVPQLGRLAGGGRLALPAGPGDAAGA